MAAEADGASKREAWPGGIGVNRDQIYSSPSLCGLVCRYHTWPTISHQTVAAHCWRVATLYCEVFGIPRAEVFFYILHHDSGELWGGDIPFTVKDRTPGMREASNVAEQEGLRRLGITMPVLTTEEWARIKIADILEMWEFGRHEMRLGNAYAQPIVNDTAETVGGRAVSSGCWDTVARWMDAQVRRLG